MEERDSFATISSLTLCAHCTGTPPPTPPCCCSWPHHDEQVSLQSLNYFINKGYFVVSELCPWYPGLPGAALPSTLAGTCCVGYTSVPCPDMPTCLCPLSILVQQQVSRATSGQGKPEPDCLGREGEEGFPEEVPWHWVLEGE